jgi:hypothetical protein
MKPGKLRLGVNIDHVATVRNARGSAYGPTRCAPPFWPRPRAPTASPPTCAKTAAISGMPTSRRCGRPWHPAELRMRRHGGNAGDCPAPPPPCRLPCPRKARGTDDRRRAGRGVMTNRLAAYIAPLRDAGCRCRCSSATMPARSKPRPASARRWWNCTPAITPTCTPKAATDERDAELVGAAQGRGAGPFLGAGGARRPRADLTTTSAPSPPSRGDGIEHRPFPDRRGDLHRAWPGHRRCAGPDGCRAA